jgi:S-methylmethionine-dependent homocysteine/selenocysteine methylase
VSDQVQLDIREQIARIDRSIEETCKFTAEQHKLQAQQIKLDAEARKFDRERWLVVAGLIGPVGGILAGVTTAAFRWVGIG